MGEGEINVPAFWSEWAYEYKAGWRVGLTDKKGGTAQSKTPRFTGAFAARRGAAFRAGRDDCMKARGLIQVSETDGRLRELKKRGIYRATPEGGER